MLVGNKLDMAESRKTPRELGEAFAQEEGLLFAEASAKSGDGVQELFLEIGQSSARRAVLNRADGTMRSQEATSGPTPAA